MTESTLPASAALTGQVAAQLRSFRGATPRVLALGLDTATEVELRTILGAGVQLAGDARELAEIDLVLDCRAGDEEKIRSFETLWPRVAAGGLYLCTSGEPGASAALRAFFADLLDDLHAFHKRGPKPAAFRETAYTRSVDSVHFYPRWIAVEQRSRSKPDMVYSGEPQF